MIALLAVLGVTDRISCGLLLGCVLIAPILYLLLPHAFRHPQTGDDQQDQEVAVTRRIVCTLILGAGSWCFLRLAIATILAV